MIAFVLASLIYFLIQTIKKIKAPFHI